MIALYDHIQELRAELRGCYMTRRFVMSWSGTPTQPPRHTTGANRLRSSGLCTVRSAPCLHELPCVHG